MAELAAAGIDRLSDLPDNILHHFLSSLDTVTIVKTSILSRRWRCLWKDVSVLCFQRKGFHSKLDFEEHVSQILANRSHHVTVGEIRLDYFLSRLSWEEPDVKVFDSVLRYAASQSCGDHPGGMSRLHHLSIRNPAILDSSYRRLTGIIASIFAHRHHESLRTLGMQVVGVAFVPMTAASGFHMLTTLQLQSCQFQDPDPFSGFPCLNHLKLYNCIPSWRGLVVLGPHLVDLDIKSLSIADGAIRVSAPKLKSFRFQDDNLRPEGYPTLDLPALDHATIHIRWHNYLLVGPGGHSYISREGSIRARLNLFRGLHNAESLILYFDSSFEITDQNSPLAEWKSPLMEHEASPFTRLKVLKIQFQKPSPTLTVPKEVIRYFFGDSFDPVNKSVVIENIEEM